MLNSNGIVWQQVPEEVSQTSNYLLPGRLVAGKVERNEFCRKLAAAGVPCTPFYPFPLYGNPLYRLAGSCRVTDCPMAEAYVNDAFWLPHRVLLSERETIQEIAEIILKILED